jgi:hypothetical protein
LFRHGELAVMTFFFSRAFHAARRLGREIRFLLCFAEFEKSGLAPMKYSTASTAFVRTVTAKLSRA